jgi:hypothetical protein
MSLAMNPAVGVAVLLALGAVLSLLQRRRSGWRLPLLTAAMAAVLWLVLFPPILAVPSNHLVVLTPGASETQLQARRFGQRVVALPGVPDTANAEAVPDLATALRRMPGIGSLTVVGAGLPARDRPAAFGLRLVLDAANPPALTALSAPPSVRLGAAWPVEGQVSLPNGRVALRDPSGAVVDSSLADAQGRFRLIGAARGLGPTSLSVQLQDAQGAALDAATLPLVVVPGDSMRVLVRFGTLNPDFKYWRRWAEDAGLDTQFSVGLSEGIALQNAEPAWTAEQLAQADVVLMDDRAWLNLPPADKQALQSAVHSGLGLMLKLSGVPDPAVAADWAQWGLDLRGAGNARAVTLDQALTLRERQAFTVIDTPARMAGWSVALAADDGSALLRWRAEGNGRLGLWTLDDSFQLMLLGDAARYGSLWTTALGLLGREHPAQEQPADLRLGRVQQRMVLCGLAPGAQVRGGAGGANVLLRVDAAGCAAYWPGAAGWQWLQSQGSESPLYVRALDDGAHLQRAADTSATRALAALPAASVQERLPTAASAEPLHWPRWPFMILWLLLATAVWWTERRSR